jgi:hypothetical protein
LIETAVPCARIHPSRPCPGSPLRRRTRPSSALDAYYAVGLSVIALPLTYWPILEAAGDRGIMGEHANGPLATTLGWAYFAPICVLTVAAPVLLIVTNGRRGLTTSSNPRVGSRR